MRKRLTLEYLKLNKMKKTILVVDDEKDIVDLLSYNLSNQNYNIITAADGASALLKVNSQIDLILLDVMMPKMSGYDVCSAVKGNPSTSDIPIIFLTAKASSDDEYEGLIKGADDYIKKPISIKNLLIRIKNILNKNDSKPNQILRFENLSIDPYNFKVYVNDKKVKLTKKEFNLLHTLVKSPGKIFRREELLNKVWGRDAIVTDRTIDVHIRKLRKKIEKDKPIIFTSHGIGYYVEDSR